jgi:hypothetical protein
MAWWWAVLVLCMAFRPADLDFSVLAFGLDFHEVTQVDGMFTDVELDRSVLDRNRIYFTAYLLVAVAESHDGLPQQVAGGGIWLTCWRISWLFIGSSGSWFCSSVTNRLMKSSRSTWLQAS